MTTFTRSARWASSAASSTENASERGGFKKPQVTRGTQRVALRPPNKVLPVQPALKPSKLQTSSTAAKCLEPKKPTLRARAAVSANHATSKEVPAADPVASLDVAGLCVEPPEKPSFSSQLLLPDGVPDIDSGDRDEPQLCAQYAKDIFDYLVSLEEAFPVKDQYLRHSPHITGDMRAILVNWLMQVHKRFQLLPETLFLTVSVIDRFLQAECVPRSKLQLVGAASMFLSAKYEEMYAPVVDDFVYVTDGAYSKGEVLRMEKAILNRLDWSLGRPIPLHFLRRISKAGQVDIVEHSLAKYALELSLLCYELSWVRPSEQAAAALCLALQLDGKAWDPTLTHYGRFSQAQLAPTVAKMAALMLDADKGKHTTTYQKFKSSRLEAVSTLALLRSAALQKIAGRT
ncbi:G2/mitotic-specific cyclin-B [Ixodes scapularis]|uniref:G2/mitotic-specific cyclin-B n=1 Tax=Ixodes scapularis TaxID=6945 RepID=UPI001161833C|nr:G2/mitotic-specific cyclin-B [Ixodes scapularis]